MGITVLVVDDHRVVADAIATRLRIERDVDKVVTANTAASAQALARAVRPEVAIVDPELGEDDGLELVREIRRDLPEVKIVVMTAHDDPETATEAVRVGASGFLPKGAPSEQLVRVVRGVMAGETHVPPRLLTSVINALQQPAAAASESVALIAKLTPREREILEHMVAGQDRATMARELYLSINTVRTHTKNILAKLKVHSTLEAVGVALAAGIRPQPSTRTG